MSSLTPSQISIVLVAPTQPGNIGSTARAMDNFGVTDLRLVNPCEVDHPEARAFSTNARYLLHEAKHFTSLQDAIKDCHLVIGTSARFRDKIHTPTSLLNLADSLKEVTKNHAIAIVFGRERSGLTNEEMSCCNDWLYIPTFGKSSSFNLAQAVVVLLYEFSKYYGNEDTFEIRDFNPATSEQVEGMKNHFFKVLEHIRFIRHGARNSIWNSFACLIGRAKPDERDVKMIRGFFSQIEISLKRKQNAIQDLKKKLES
jgi:tRNA/rRNA methyltransferase